MVTGPSKPSYSIGAFTFANSPSAQRFNSEGEMADHSHTVYTDDNFCAYLTGNNNNKWKQGLVNIETPSKGVKYAHYIGSVGGDKPHNNLPPFYGVYRFRRVS